MFDWNDLQYVLALGEGGTMKRAAELLHTNATTVSRHIKSLSDRLGVVLFTRHKSGLCILTPEGERLKAIAADTQRRLQSFETGKSGGSEKVTIKISSLEFLISHYLAHDIAAGMACYPDTQISLVGSDRRVSLAFGEADLALRFDRPTEGQLIASKVAEIDFMIWRPIAEQNAGWVGLEEEFDWTPEMQMGLKHYGYPPTVRVSSFLAARNAGLSMHLDVLAPASVMVRHLDDFRYLPTPVVSREVWSVIHESRKHSKRLLAVRNWARKAVQDGLVAQSVETARAKMVAE